MIRVPPMIKVDFRDDWKKILDKKLAACGLQYDQSCSLEDNTIRYLNADRRIPRSARRTIHESKELRIPPEYLADYSGLKKLMSEGGDLTPYLSRDIQRKKRADKSDGLLNAWGIQHLHFRPNGTGDVLFVKITEADVFVITALPHDPKVWVDTSLLQVLHENWPEEMAACVGVHGEPLTATGRLTLRGLNVNFATTMLDGAVYMSPGGGIMGSGRCLDDIVTCDKIFVGLASLQKVVEDNEGSIRGALNVSPSEELSIKLMFGNDEYWLYEPTRHVRLSLLPQR
jgi:hypothetical protein